MSQFEKEYHQVEKHRASVCLRYIPYLYVDNLVLPRDVLGFSISKENRFARPWFWEDSKVYMYLPPSEYSGEGETKHHMAIGW